jgi:hypothetical protein
VLGTTHDRDDLFEREAPARRSLPRAVAAAQLAGGRRRQPGQVHGDRDPVNPGARIEGCIRATDDEVLIIDSTPELVSTGRFASERVRR